MISPHTPAGTWVRLVGEAKHRESRHPSIEAGKVGTVIRIETWDGAPSGFVAFVTGFSLPSDLRALTYLELPECLTSCLTSQPSVSTKIDSKNDLIKDAKTMFKPVSLCLVAAAFLSSSAPTSAESLFQSLLGSSNQSSLLGVSSSAYVGISSASGGQLNLNVLNQAGTLQSPLIAAGASFLLNQSVLAGAGSSSILQTSVNEIQSISTGVGGLALAALTGPQTAFNTINVANVALTPGASANFLQNFGAGGPSILTSTNLLSSLSTAGSAFLMGNGQTQSSGVEINSIVLSLPGPAHLLVGQSGPTGGFTIVSGNTASATGKTGATIVGP